MPFETLFSAAGTAALAGWLALALAPLRWQQVMRVVTISIAVALSMLYAGLIGAFFAPADGGFGSLADVAHLFDHPGVLLAGWVHYLAFDLLVGCWEREEAARIGLPRWALVPCLALTFLLGPIGWLAFLAVRAFATRPAAHPRSTAAA